MYNADLGFDPNDLFSLEALRDDIRQAGAAKTGRVFGLSRKTLSKIANGSRTPGTRVLAKLGVARVTRYLSVEDIERYQQRRIVGNGGDK